MKKVKKTNSTLDMMKSIRKPMPPATRFHSTEKGKRGYNRKHNKRNDWEMP